MNENDVVDAVAAYLTDHGYRVNTQLTTLQRGIDLEAVHLASGRRLLIEAKGGTSSKPGSKRYGKDFDDKQALSHVSRAFFSGSKLLQKHSGEAACVALAFPGDKTHRILIEEIRTALETLSIAVFFVVDAQRVDILGNIL